MSGVLHADTRCGICLAKFVTCEETLASSKIHIGERMEEHWRIICIQVIWSQASLQNVWFAAQFKENPTLSSI